MKNHGRTTEEPRKNHGRTTMTTNITISSIAHSQNKSHDGNTFDVTYINTPDGSFTAYP